MAVLDGVLAYYYGYTPRQLEDLTMSEALWLYETVVAQNKPKDDGDAFLLDPGAADRFQQRIQRGLDLKARWNALTPQQQLDEAARRYG